MFTIKADFIRMGIGVALCLSGFWPFEFVGALLCLMAAINFGIHVFNPKLVQDATTKYANANDLAYGELMVVDKAD